MEVDDPYRELGIPQDASDAEVKAAWRRLAARWHPDRNSNPAAVRKIQRINRALEEIRKARRSSEAADGDRHADADANSGSDGEAAANGSPPGEDEPSPHQERGGMRAFQHTVSLTLEQAWAGCVKDISGEVVDPCAACAATGVDPAPVACGACEGTGQVRQPLWFGWLSAPAECADCRGRGELPRACKACSGSGHAPPRSYRARVRIPPGMRHGEQLHVPPSSRRGAGGRSQALAIAIDILPHPFLSLDEDGTVRCEVPVDGFAWMAERWTEVPTPSGLQQMRLRRGHLVYRIKGQGFPVPGTRTRADCLVAVTPLFPKALDETQEALVDQLVASNSENPATEAGRRLNAWHEGLARWEPGPPG